MGKDPYSVLGVPRGASQKEIRSAFRSQAKKLHPDLNPNDASAEKRFKDISLAYDIVGDADRRARFDRGEIDAEGNERAARHAERGYASAGGGPFASGSGFSSFGDADDIFSQFFSRRSGGGRARMRGEDSHYAMTVDFLDAVNGTTSEISLPHHGSSVDIRIPPGTRDGQTLRLKGKGQAGIGGAEPGDALIDIRVRAHAFFVRDGDDIRLELPVTLREAVLGAKVPVPTPKGTVTVKLPENASTGKVMRLKGRGVPKRNGERGDVYASLRIMLPERPDEALKAFAAKWADTETKNPRSAMGV